MLFRSMVLNVMSNEDPDYVADFIAQNIVMRVTDKQAILEELRPVPRLNKLLRILHREVEILEMAIALSETTSTSPQEEKIAFANANIFSLTFSSGAIAVIPSPIASGVLGITRIIGLFGIILCNLAKSTLPIIDSIVAFSSI